tara:strand:- start:257 stop:871 length:615 start_codon:yes stop_codon:yes gene_type:complete
MVIPNKDVRSELISLTEAFVVPYLTFDYYDEFGYDKPKKHYKIPQAINIDYLRNNFLVEKEDVVFDYENYWASGRLPRNKEVIDRIDYKTTALRTETWEDCLNSWKHCKFLFNLDKTFNVGQQAIQSAALDNIVLGGNNDAHKLLFPDLAGMDIENIVYQFRKLTEDFDYYESTKKYAFEKLNEIYSLDSVKNKIINKIGELDA